LGSSCLESDGAGAVISYEEYHPFGTTAYSATLSSLGASAKRYRYCGKERDEESGLYYYGARYYAGWLGRFVSVDPKESKYFFQSSYAYAENSPVTKMDFNGEGTGEGDEKKILQPKSGNGTEVSATFKDGKLTEFTVTASKSTHQVELGFEPDAKEINKIEAERQSSIEKYYSTPQVFNLKNSIALPNSTLNNASASSDYISVEGPAPKKPTWNDTHPLATGRADFDAGTAFIVGGLATSMIKAGAFIYEGVQVNRVYGSKELFHYTSARNAKSIMNSGLTVTEQRIEIFMTPNGKLSPIQAQLDLSLNSNRSFPNSVISVNTRSLLREGITPSRGPKLVQGNLPGTSGGGGGVEVIFNRNIPKDFLKRRF